MRQTGTSVFALFISFAITIAAFAQNAEPYKLSDKKSLEAFLDSMFLKEMDKSKLPGAVISIVHDGKIIFSKGYGYANVDTKVPVDPAKTIFRIGSITKVFTALATLQLADKGSIRLDDDVNNYLKEFKVPNTYSRPVKISDLLTHSGGFDEISKGRKVYSESQLTPLNTFLSDRLVRIRPAGEVSSYNTYGMTLAGYIVEQVSGMSLKDYFRKQIFDRLDMQSSSLGTIPQSQIPNFAKGYEYSKQSGYTPLPFVWFNTYPASDINSTATDMAHFMIALLDEGKYRHQKILSKKMQAEMLHQQQTNHPGVPGWTYGLQESRKLNGEAGLEHGGSMDDGFSSLMYLMPDHDIGIFIAATRESTNIYDVVKEAFIRRFFPMKNPPLLIQPPEELKKDLERFAGSYRWDPYCHSCADSSAYYAQSFKVVATTDGLLSFWSGKWAQVKPLLFQLVDGQLAGQVYVAFREDGDKKITHLFLGGPWTYEKYNPQK